MTSLTESRHAFEARAREVGLADEDIAALTGSGITSLARLAFAAVQPGAQPTNEQVRELFGTRVVNAGVVAATKRLIFESHTLVVADLKQKVEKGDDPTSQSSIQLSGRHESSGKRLGSRALHIMVSRRLHLNLTTSFMACCSKTL